MRARRLVIGAATVLLVVSGAGGGAASAARPGLVLALGFEDGAGQLARDASGLGNDAVLSGARFTAEGRFGGAVECEDDWLTVSGADALDLTEAFTISAWVKLRSLGGDQMTLALKEGSDHPAYAVWARSAGRVPLGLSRERVRVLYEENQFVVRERVDLSVLVRPSAGQTIARTEGSP